MKNYCASTIQTNSFDLANQFQKISNCTEITVLMEAAVGLLIILNEDGQIVRSNNAAIEAFGNSSPDGVLGLRFGDAFGCDHASRHPHECGTTLHCETCGVAIAIMASINDDQVSEQSCVITVKKNSAVFERYLSVRARPLKIDNNRWILIVAQDITHQHSLSTLEHIFYHDINNILAVLVGNCDMLASEMPGKYRVRQIQNTANKLCAEITLQHFLNRQKFNADSIWTEQEPVGKIKNEVELIVYGHPKSYGKKIEQIWPDRNIHVHTNILLVSRIIGNMLLNAFEATDKGGTVRLTTTVNDTDIKFEVWNEAFIDPEMQTKIFNLGFSTKASIGRGLGTYSMKLFGEQYLNGKVSFNSSIVAGTSFCFQHPLSPV
jgi:K+-sensing histidine kinase KdpD